MPTRTSASFIRAGVGFFWDWFISHWPTLLAFIFGGGALSIAGTMTDWLRAWGPILWAILFFAGALVGLLLYGLFVWISRQAISNQFVRKSLDDSSINVLENSFDKKDIQIQTFFNPYYTSNSLKRFTSCRISGPAMVVMMEENNIINCKLFGIQVIIARPGIITGGIVFSKSTFVDCHIYNLTFIMNKATYDYIVVKDNGFSTVPVIAGP